MGRKRHTIIKKKNDNSNHNVSEFSYSDDSRNDNSLDGYRKLILVLIATLIILLFRGHIVNRVIVEGVSMNDTLNKSDVLIARKFDIESISTNDIVIASWNNKMIIKRIIGVPSDNIKIYNNALYVNGKMICDDDKYKLENTEYILKNDEYFLLGDNYLNSIDSRIFGAIKIENIKGVVLFRIYPFNKFGSIPVNQ